MCNDISEILGIKVKNLKITQNLGLHVHKNVQALFYEGQLTYHPSACECCGIKNDNHLIIKHGFRKTNVYMGLIFERPAYLKLKKQRFYCKACQRTFTAETPYIQPRCTISNEVKRMMTWKLSKVTSEKDIAESLCVSPSTVHRHLKVVSNSVKTHAHYVLPEHLAFDEFKSTKDVEGAMSFIYCDSVTHDIIDILPDRRKHQLEAYFLKFSRKQREKVKTVSIDMFPPYIALIQDLFPDAEIIIDRFHIVQAINREINRCRVQVMNGFRTKERPQYNKLKRYWKLLLKAPIDLDRMIYQPYRLFKSWQSQYSLVQYLLNLDETLKETYETGHRLLSALKANDIQQLRFILQDAKTKDTSKGLKRVIHTFIKYMPYISSTMRHRHLTNGPIEGINNKIKLIKRVSYGYRNFWNFRNRILMISKVFVSEYKKRIKQQNNVA